MEPNKVIENSDCVDEDIRKLSFKQLKELAIQRNINPKLKKVQLVEALISTKELTFHGTTEFAEHSSNGRITRARASVLKNVDNGLSYPFVTGTNNEKISFINAYETEKAGKKHKNKTRGKRLKRENKEESHKLNESKSGNPLSEITNTDVLLDSEFERGTSLIEETDLFVNQNNLNLENRLPVKEIKSKLEVLSNSYNSSDVNNIDNNANNNQEIISKKRGRKKKTVKESNKNVTPSTSPDRCDGEILYKTAVKLENEINKSNQSEGSVTQNYEPKQAKRRRKGKKGKVTDSLLKSTEESVNLNAEEHIREEENKLSSRGSKSSKTDSKGVTSSSGVTDSVHLNFSVENSKAVSKQGLQEELQENSSHENMPIPAPVRSSTFVLDDKELPKKKNVTEDMPVHAPVRSSTFVLDNKDSETKETRASMPRRSDTFLIQNKDSVNKSTPAQNANSSKKSIGARIISSSLKLGSINKGGKQHGQGSTVKKTITKNTTTPGSVYKSKFSGARKAPNFKAIHQKLFKNMESLGDNKKRTLERAKGLLQSPVPRCAVASPKWELKKKIESTITTTVPDEVDGVKKEAEAVETKKQKTSPDTQETEQTETKTPAVVTRKQDMLERRLINDKGPAPLSPKSPKVEEAGGGSNNVGKRESRERTSRPVSMMPTVNGQKEDAPQPTHTLSSSASNSNRPKEAITGVSQKIQTPGAKRLSTTTAPKSTSINRFGFHKTRRPMNKEVANSIVGMKMPPINLERKKDEERALIQGVRTNKRFLLQMQMRQNKV